MNPPMEFVPNADWFETAGQSLAEALVMGASRALGIEDDELEGGFRTRSAELTDDEEVRGFIEIFLFDTTAGGAGFSSKVWEEFADVLDETRVILEGCKCDTACHNCLRRYQNRHLHESLNRHQGLALLDYAETGDPPTLQDRKIAGLLNQLERALQLQADGVKIDRGGDANRWTVTLNGSEHTFSIRSSLREPLADDAQFDEDYSDYELSHELPDVAYSIIDRLE